MDSEWRLRAAAGYAELGMNRESMAELNAIAKPERDRPEVLQLRLHHLMREKKWARALVVSIKRGEGDQASFGVRTLSDD